MSPASRARPRGWRARVWKRASFKPHGSADDDLTLEWMYDLKDNPCQEPTQPGVVDLGDLDAPEARALATHLAGLLAPGGALTVSNFVPSDPSRPVRAWLTDWHLVYRDRGDLAAVMAAGLAIRTEGSPDGTLAYAVGRRGE
jgi:hypothetical protein